MTDIATVRELLRRAILTLAVIDDPDRRYRSLYKGAWPQIVQDTRDAYAAAPPKIRLFEATPADVSRYLDVLSWLNWYSRQCPGFPGRASLTISLFKAWTFGVPMWELQRRCITNRRREAASAKTVHNRINGMLKTIKTRYRDDILLYRIDGFPELPDIDLQHPYGQDCVESDFYDLPTSPKAVISAIPEPLTPRQEARAHAALSKRLNHNSMRAQHRKQQEYHHAMGQSR